MEYLKQRILDALYPTGVACCVCGSEAIVDDFGVCGKCQSAVERENEVEGNGAVNAFRAGLKYNSKISPAMQAFKYNGARYLASFFAQFMEINECWNIDVVVPVPLHKKKQRKRGYNQSELLARFVAERYSIPVDTITVKRKKDTPTQTHMTALERAENMSDAFAAGGDMLKGKNVLLIDDVRTTGSTLNACAEAARAAGAKNVFALTACAASLE